MALNINVNMMAYNANNRLQSHFSNLSRSVQKLSSGLRLNSAEDGPVDMGVYNIHEARLGVLDRGRYNINDAISAVQTAESAMARIDELLIKMKEVATYSATGTITAEQREILSTEFEQLAVEIDRIALYTEFKGIKLLNGSLSTKNNSQRQGSFITANKKRFDEANIDPAQNGLKIHFGPGNNRLEDYYFIRIGDLTMDGLLKDVGDPNIPSKQKIAVSTQHAAQIAMETIFTAMLHKEKNRYVMGLMQNRLEATMRTLDDEILNLTAASSNIADVDFAKEMSNFARSQILAQAATAMSAQANVLPQIALKLLRF